MAKPEALTPNVYPVEGRTPLSDEMKRVYQRDALEGQQLHDKMGRVVERHVRPGGKILIINTAPTFPFSDPNFWELDPAAKELVQKAHIGKAYQTSKEVEIPGGERVEIPDSQIPPDLRSSAATFAYALGFEPDDERFEIWDVARGDRKEIPSPRSYAGVIVTGSSWMVTDIDEGGITDPNIGRVSDVVEFLDHWEQQQKVAKVHGGIPKPTILDCFGHQINARRNRKDAVRKMTEREFGMIEAELNPAAHGHELLRGFGDKVALPSTHTQYVENKPENAVVLGGNAVDKNKILAYSNFPGAISFQDHLPDLWPSMLHVLAQLRREALTRTGFDFEAFDRSLIACDYESLVSAKEALLSNFLMQADAAYQAHQDRAMKAMV